MAGKTADKLLCVSTLNMLWKEFSMPTLCNFLSFFFSLTHSNNSLVHPATHSALVRVTKNVKNNNPMVSFQPSSYLTFQQHWTLLTILSSLKSFLHLAS